jgi:hypothetical protein
MPLSQRRPWSHVDLRLDPTTDVDLLRVPAMRRVPLKLTRRLRRRAREFQGGMGGQEQR